MNEDRNNLLDPAAKRLERVLIDEVASFVVDLLPEVLFDRFGASAYSAVQVVAKDSSAPRLATSIEKHLANRPCWPSRTTIRKRIQFAVASTLTVPIEQLSDFASVLRAQSVVHEAVSTDTASATWSSLLGPSRSQPTRSCGCGVRGRTPHPCEQATLAASAGISRTSQRCSLT